MFLIFQGTDIFAAVLFYFEGYHAQSFITIGLVFLPGFCIYISELRRSFCTKPCVSLPKAIGYLLFSPLWAIVIHIYSLCDERYVKSALYFKTLQGKVFSINCKNCPFKFNDKNQRIFLGVVFIEE